MHWKDLVSMQNVFVEESVKRAAERMAQEDTLFERLRGDAFLAARLPFSTAARCTGCGKTP